MGGTRCKYMATVTPYGIHTPTPEEMDLEMDQQDDAEFTANVLEAFRLCAGLEGSDKLPFLRDVELIFRALVVEATSLGEGAKGERLQALATLGWACVSGVAQRCEQRHHKRAFRGVVDGIMQDAAGRRKYGLGRLFYHGILRPYVEAMLRPKSGRPVKRWLKDDDRYAHHSGPRTNNVDAMARHKGIGRALKNARAVRDAERKTVGPTKTVLEVKSAVNAKYPPAGSARQLSSWTERPLIPQGQTQVDWEATVQGFEAEGVSVGQAAGRVAALQHTFGRESAEVDQDTLEAALRCASVAASSGASSETNALLLHCYSEGDDLEKELLPFVCGAVAGRVGGLTREILLACRVAVWEKEGSEGDIRAVAMPACMVRLIERALNMSVQRKARDYLGPAQFGVGRRMGGQVMGTVLSDIWQRGDELMQGDSGAIPSPESELLCIDAANAFPSLRLECIIDALREGCPELLWWFHFTYGGDGALQFDSKGVEYVRARCLRQGSTLASLFFAFGAKKAYDRVIARHAARNPSHGVGGVSYVDDLTALGDLEISLREDEMRKLEADLDSAGLKIQMRKMVALTHARVGSPRYLRLRALADARGLRLETEGVKVVGAPVGTNAGVRAQVRASVDAWKDDLNLLDQFGEKQVRLALLRHCLGAPQAQYQASIVGEGECDDEYEALDRAVDDRVLELLDWDAPTEDERWRVAEVRRLPTELGGFGIRSVLSEERTSNVIMVLDAAQRYTEQHFPNYPKENGGTYLTDKLSWRARPPRQRPPGERAGREVKAPAREDLVGRALRDLIPRGKANSAFEESCCEVKLGGDVNREGLRKELRAQRLMRAAERFAAVREGLVSHDNYHIYSANLFSCADKDASRFLTWCGGDNRLMRLHNPELMHMIRMRCALPPLRNPGEDGCSCSASAIGLPDSRHRKYKTNPYEALSCNGVLASGKIARHHAVRDLLAKHLNKVGTTAIEQPVPGAPELRGDILFYAHGKRVTIDVTLTAQCAPTLAAKGAWKQAGYAADAAWKRKHQTYWRAAEPNAGPGGQCRDVVPFVLEISGRLFSKSRAWLERAFGGDKQRLSSFLSELSYLMASRVGSALSMGVRAIR